MDNKEMALYAAQMEEIKRRLNVIEYYLTGKGHALYEPTTIESSCLQVRKVLELIAFSTLVSNKSMIEEVQKKFSN
jgi:hypothetical protein